MGSCRFLFTTPSLVALAVGLFAGAVAQPLGAQSTAVQVANQPATPQWEIDAGGKMAFDVASVKQNKSSDLPHANFPIGNGAVMFPVGGLFSIGNIALRDIIAFAYKLTIPQTHTLMLGLPSWIDSERFDIEARAEGNPTKDEFRLMVQSVLADRFKMTIHRETRQLPVYWLVLSQAGKTGTQLKPHTDDTLCLDLSTGPKPIPAATPPGGVMPPLPCGGIAGFGAVPNAPGQLWMGARKVTMALLAAELSEFDSNVDRPVLDRSGLSGTFDLMLQWAPQPRDLQPGGFQPDPTGPTFLEALKDQLGLKLESQTGPVDVLVIDHLEQPSEN
jgi:uncharacterized protein (TIGR03435 family)